MLSSVVRRPLRQSSLFRTLAAHARSNATLISGSSTGTPSHLQASTIVNPVYVALSPPLNPRKDDPKPGEVVAALDPTVFNHPIRRDILHLCVIHHLDSLRQGTASTKTRGEVRGSGRKLRRQKGTGKARIGDGQSPILRGGGVAFGPKPRDFSTKLPRKVIEMGMRVGLSVKVKERSLMVMPRISWPNPKTRHLSRRIDTLGLRKTLFVATEADMFTTNAVNWFSFAVRNIPMVKLVKAHELTVYELMKWKKVVLSVKAVEYLESLLAKDVPVTSVPLIMEAYETQEAAQLESRTN